MSWINIEEQIPPKKGEYLVAYYFCLWDKVDYNSGLLVGTDSFRGGKEYSYKSWAKNKYQRVKYWMPMPLPPIEKNGVKVK